MRIRNPKGIYKLTCSKCDKPIENELVGRQRYCRKCKAENTKLHRKNYSELSEEEKMKSNARAYLHVYVKRGKLTKLPCSICGDEKSEAHHTDYNKPIDVIWYCRKCHMEQHK